MSNLNMDLSGSLETYKETGKVFRIFKYEQNVDFESTVFKDTLDVKVISGGITEDLVYGTDYIIPDEFKKSCDNDISRAKFQDPSFDRELISGIQIIRGYTVDYTICVAYQRLYPNHIRTAYFHNEPLNLTPELMLDVLQSIEQLKVLTNKVTEVTSISDSESILLELDTSETNNNNKIADEPHLVDVVNGRFMVQPKGGSFYRDSVSVYHPDSDTKLVLNKDYFIVGMDEAKTKATSSPAPVYNFIMITKQLTGKILVSYHAFGGDPTLDNYKELLSHYNNLVNYINDAKTVTEESLGSTSVMTSLFERVETLEKEMRRLQGSPAYGDITSGKCTLMKLFSDTTGLHWYTIAKLFTTNGTNVVPCSADTFVFRLQTQLSHIQFTVAVSVDLNNKGTDRFNVNVIAENYPRGYVPFIDYGEIANIIRPQLRLVWNDQDQLSGAYLQLGFTLTNMLEETISIEDMSGHESCWKLVDEVSTVTLPQDDLFMLPDGVSTWSSKLSKSQSETMLVPFKNGHIIWAGSKSMNRPVDGWQYFDITTDLILDADTDITKFSKLRLDIEEIDGFQFPVDINFNSRSGILKGHSSFTHQDQPAYVNAEISKLDDGTIRVRLNYDITAGTASNELVLRDLVVFL